MNESSNEFEPRKGIAERYSKNSFSPEEIENAKDAIKLKDDLIQKYLDKGYTQEQAEATAYRTMYIPCFSGPTFKD